MSPDEAKVDCVECGASIDATAGRCYICGAARGEGRDDEGSRATGHPRADRMGPASPSTGPSSASPPPSAGCPSCGAAASEVERFDDGSTICGACGHAGPGEAARLVDKLAAEMERDLAAERTGSARAAEEPAGTPAEWSARAARARRARGVAAVEAGLLAGVQAMLMIELAIYLVSFASSRLGASGAELFVTHAPAITSAFFAFGVGLAACVAWVLRRAWLGGGQRADFAWVQACALLAFLPPFLFVVFDARFPLWAGAGSIALVLGAAGVISYWRFGRARRPFPVFLSAWVAGAWIFLSVQAGVFLREALLSAGTPAVGWSFEYYLHFGVYDYYLLLLGGFLLTFGFWRMRSAYRSRAMVDENLALGSESYESGDPRTAFGFFSRAGNLAEESLERGEQPIDADHALALAGKGACELRMGLPGDAAATLRTATERDPANPLAWNLLGVALRAQQEHEAALRAIDRALALDPGYAGAQNNAGVVLHRMHRYGDAVERFRAAISIDEEHVDAWLNLGYSHLAMGNNREALRCAARAETLMKARGPPKGVTL